MSGVDTGLQAWVQRSGLWTLINVAGVKNLCRKSSSLIKKSITKHGNQKEEWTSIIGHWKENWLSYIGNWEEFQFFF